MRGDGNQWMVPTIGMLLTIVGTFVINNDMVPNVVFQGKTLMEWMPMIGAGFFVMLFLVVMQNKRGH